MQVPGNLSDCLSSAQEWRIRLWKHSAVWWKDSRVRGWETGAQLWKFGGGLKTFIENCENSSLFLSNYFPGLTICGKCFSSLPLWNSQSNGKVTALFFFLIMIFSYSFNCWPTYCFWFEGDIRPAFSYIELIFTILILRSEHLVSFLSRNEPQFFFFFFSPLVLSQHFLTRLLALCAFWKKSLTVAEQCWAVAKESFREAPGSSQPGWKCYFSMLGLLCFSS